MKMDDSLKIIYLDKEFISILYESEKGYSPQTKITKTEGAKASASLPIFTAGISSVESKSYSISTVGMLKELSKRLNKFGSFNESSHELGKSSLYCWVEGNLTIDQVEVKRRKYTVTIVGEPKPNPTDHPEKVVAEEVYFALKTETENFALVSTPDYFSSGLASFIELADTVIGQTHMPVKALIRVFSAQTSFKHWVAAPLVVIEP